MNDSFETAGTELPELAAGDVHTSAQAVSETQNEPAVGGSYIRNAATGDLVKQEPAAEIEEKE